MVKIKNEENKCKIYPEKPHLIFCEGFDAWRFLCELLNFFEQQNSAFATFCAYNFGGNNELRDSLRVLPKTENFNIVKSICIIRDAEKNANNASKSVQSSLKAYGFAVPDKPCSWSQGGTVFPDISIGFALFPTLDRSPIAGTLEDLCLKILSESDAPGVLAQADTALQPYKGRLPRLPKNRLHTYFSLTDNFVSCKIGEAATYGAFNYDAPELEAFKNFLGSVPNRENSENIHK